MKGLMFLTLLAAWLPGIALADGTGVTTPPVARITFRDRSDEELTSLAAGWDSLDKHQRRALLTEMKRRMASPGEPRTIIRIRTERRYGRIIRQSDGRVIHIETQVVHVRPLSPQEIESRQAFGVGFEQRVARRQDDPIPVNPAPESQTMIPKPAEPIPLLELPLYRVSNPAP